MEEPRHDPPNTALAKKALLGLNFFIETNRMEAFVAVYYCFTDHGGVRIPDTWNSG